MRNLILIVLMGVLSLCVAGMQRNDDAAPTVLFVRGGEGTGGFLEAKNRESKTEQLADITNAQSFRGNHGWATLAQLLKESKFDLRQFIEGTAEKPKRLPVQELDASKNAIIVFASNNLIYTQEEADAFWAYIKAGGSALFISDANFGNAWQDAPNSDQSLLERTGVIVNQDHGHYAVKRDAGDFVAPDHPILKGVQAMDGEGVSPIQMPAEAKEGFKVTQIIRAKDQTRDNARTQQGKNRPVTERDSALLVIEHGKGRVACHFDRNTFFNKNGAGTDIHRLDNRTYAINLFNWLAFRE